MSKVIDIIKKYGVVSLGIICILPFLMLSFFIHPVGAHGWDWATQYIGDLPYGLGLWEEQIYWYNNTMGRYASTGIMSLTRFWFSISAFKLFPIVFIGLMFCSLLYLLKSIFFQQKKPIILTLSISIFLLYLDQLTGVYEGFYNFSCVITYQVGGICLFFLIGLMIRMMRNNSKDSIIKNIVAGIFIFITVGANEITLVATNGWLFLLLQGEYFYKRVWSKWILGLFVFSLTFSFFEILAPGNYTRMELAENSGNLFLTIFLTVSVSLFNWIRWFSSTPLLIFAMLYLPIGFQVAKNQSYKPFFKHSFFVGLGIVSFQVLSLFLLFWSQGDETLPERLIDLIFWISLPGLLYVWQSLIFLFLDKKWISKDFRIPSPFRWSLVFFVVVFLFFKDLRVDKSEEAKVTSNYLSIIQTNSNIGNAWLELLSGKAQSYDETQFEIYEQIKNSTSDTLFINPELTFPQIIYDKTYDRKFMKGEPYMSHYFRKDLIVKYKE